MSRIFEALQSLNPELSSPTEELSTNSEVSSLVTAMGGDFAGLEDAHPFRIPESPTVRLVAWTAPNSLASEHLRVLSARLRHARQRRSVKKILVTSAVRGDGKSAVSANLAIALASHGENTLLIDGDLHQPSLSKTLAVNGDRGFATCYQNGGTITGLLHRAESLPLWFLPAGIPHEQPMTLLQSPKTGDLLQQLSNCFTWIVIDSPPLVPLADSGVWANLSDVVVLVARQGLTPKSALTKCVECFDKSKLFALLMNDADVQEEKYYNSYYSAKIAKAEKTAV